MIKVTALSDDHEEVLARVLYLSVDDDVRGEGAAGKEPEQRNHSVNKQGRKRGSGYQLVNSLLGGVLVLTEHIHNRELVHHGEQRETVAAEQVGVEVKDGEGGSLALIVVPGALNVDYQDNDQPDVDQRGDEAHVLEGGQLLGQRYKEGHEEEEGHPVVVELLLSLNETGHNARPG